MAIIAVSKLLGQMRPVCFYGKYKAGRPVMASLICEGQLLVGAISHCLRKEFCPMKIKLTIISLLGLVLLSLAGNQGGSAKTLAQARMQKPPIPAISLGNYLSAMPPTGNLLPADKYGAIAYTSVPKRRVGWAVNRPTRMDAEAVAMYQCGRDCVVRVWFKNTCGVLVAGNVRPDGKRGMYTAWSQYKIEAEETALRKCSGSGESNCEIIASVCNAGAGN
jgi:hypothetical protein